jgi:hypothetical protein
MDPCPLLLPLVSYQDWNLSLKRAIPSLIRLDLLLQESIFSKKKRKKNEDENTGVTYSKKSFNQSYKDYKK